MAPDDDALIGSAATSEVSVMSLNVQRARGGSTGWRRRRDRLGALLARERPTILGVQEALPHQATFVREALGDTYRFVGKGRDADGSGEGCPVFWDERRLELVDWEQRALSRTPDAAGSRSWGSLFPRILTRTVFSLRATGIRFVVVNTHLDVLSPVARRRSADLLAQSAGSGPALILGDFNSDSRSAPRLALSEAGFADTWTLATTRATREWRTYRGARPPRPGGPRIDAVYARDLDVPRVAIDARPIEGGWASDHLPVQAIVRMRKGKR